MSFDFLMITISKASLLAPVTAGLLAYGKLERTFRILFFFLVFSIGIEIAAHLFVIYYRNNMPLLHVFTILEFLVFAYVFYSYFDNRQALRKGILVLTVLFIPVSVFNMFTGGGLWKFNAMARSYESVVIVLLALAYYYLFFKENLTSVVWKQPMFWFSTAVFIYFAMNQFFFMLVNELLKYGPALQAKGVLMHSFINICANLLFAISFRCFQKPITA